MENPIVPSPVSVKLQRIPKPVWFLLAGIAAALIAIFVFKVAVSTAVYYSFLGLMVSSHFFMHGGHGSHGTRSNQNNPQSAENVEPGQKDSHAGHGGCH